MSKKYELLESLIFRGFLTTPYYLKDTFLVFRTLSTRELLDIEVRCGDPLHSKYDFLYQLNFLIKSLYLVNGFNVLPYKETYYLELLEIFKNTHPFIIKNIFATIRRASTSNIEELYDLMEGFCYDRKYRNLWTTKKLSPLNSPINTGILGTDLIPLNDFQEYWLLSNTYEDQKDKFEQRYNLSKFITSFIDGKATRNVDSQDKAKAEEEEERRKNVIQFGSVKANEHVHNPADTRDGAASEISKMVSGIKDEHDLAIEQYEEEIRTNMLYQLKNMKDVQKKYSEKRGTGVYEETRVISQEELQQRLTKRSHNNSQIFNTKEVMDVLINNKISQTSKISNEELIEKTGIMTKEDLTETSKLFNLE